MLARRSMFMFPIALCVLAGPARSQCFVTKIQEAGGGAEHRFGMTVLQHDDVLFVAEEEADASGRVHVYSEQPSGWVEITSFVPAAARPGLRFGAALSADGDELLVGSSDDDGSWVPGKGGAWIFVRDRQETPTPLDDRWVELQALEISDPWTSQYFGRSVALCDGIALLGVPLLEGAPQRAAAYVFARDDRSPKTLLDDRWTEQARLDPDPATATSSLGACVALIDGGGLALASDSRDQVGANGGVLLYARDKHGSSDRFDDTWQLTGQIDAPAGGADSLFGNFIVDGERLFAFGGIATPGSSVLRPCIVVYERTAGAWSSSQVLDGDVDGASMAADGDLLMTTVPGWGGPPSHGDEMALFARVAGAWTLQSIVRAPDEAPYDEFGCSVDLVGSRAYFGAHGWPYRDDYPAVEGAVWVAQFDEPNGWTALSDTNIPEPSLAGWGRLDGQSTVTLHVYDTFWDGNLVVLVAGASELNLPIGDDVLVPTPDLLLPLVMSPGGDVSVSGIWPPGLPPGFSVWFQAWVVTGYHSKPWSVSNAVRATQTSD
jgi:hypothetical protein